MSEQAINILRKFLEKVSPDSDDEFYRSAAQTRDAKETVLAKYRQIFSSENLCNLTADDFKSFLLFRNNRHWRNLHRQGGMITANMPQLRNTLKLLLDEKQLIKDRLDQLRPQNRPPMVKGLGRAVISAILQVMYPDKYGVLNGIVETGMRELGLWPDFQRGATFGDKYGAVNGVLLKDAKELKIDLWTLDILWWIVTHSQIE